MNRHKSTRLPVGWRNRLPSPARYYADHVDKLGQPNAAGWAQGRCPFHEDHAVSLSVQVIGERGMFKCFAGCGRGDLVTYHMRATGQEFADAVRDLMGMR